MAGREKIGQKLRALPAMEKILSDSRLCGYESFLERDVLKSVCRAALDRWRERLIDEEETEFSEVRFFGDIVADLERRRTPGLRKVLNGTGVVIHTNLGRSPLAAEAVQAISDVASGYSTLEFNLESGRRGHRNDHVEWLLCQITGAEAALVVNNNASAVLLTLAALARGYEAVVSRGELVEIGGSFRVPDIMAFAGVDLVEIGCTNRTHLSDYEKAITDRTKLLMKVHPSNFRMTGFTSAPERSDLAELAHSRGLLYVEDLGSGVLVSGDKLGLYEPSVKECLDAGCDLVTVSGDKMLGGPQIGAILGKREVVRQLRNFQLLRALRCDKLSLSAMEATLRLYLAGDWERLPTLAMIAASPAALYAKASRLKDRIDRELADLCFVTGLAETQDAVGGGSCPETPLAGWAVSLRPQAPLTAGRLSIELRRVDCPLVTGGRDGNILLHTRTLPEDQFDLVLAGLRQAWDRCHEC